MKRGLFLTSLAIVGSIATAFSVGATAATLPSPDQIRADLDGPYRTQQATPNLSFRGPLARQVEPLLLQQAHYLISTLHPWDKDPRALSLTKCGSNENNIRPNATTVAGLAVVARCIKDDYPAGLSPEICRDKAIAILRFILPTHGVGGMTCDNGKQWKDQWQSAHWAAAAGRGAWLLWDDLDPQLQWLAANMICEEADRFVGKTPPAQVQSDTKAEENAWNSEVIALAAAIFPHHPHHEQWKETAIAWALSSFVREADLRQNPVIDGKPLRDRVKGANVYDDYTLENHNRVHPDYMGTFILCNFQKLIYDWGHMPAPKSIDFNAPQIYASLKKLSFPDGGWIYPNGQDWRLHRNPDWLNIHVSQMTWFHDPQAARLARIVLDAATRMADRNPNGGIYEPGEYFFASTQHSLIDWTAQSYLLLRAYGEGPKPVTEKQLWRDLAGKYIFTNGKFGVLRTTKSVATFSWGRQVMGMVLPLQQDLLLAPNEHSLTGIVSVKGVKREAPKVKSVSVHPDKKTFAVSGVLDRAGGRFEQRFAFVALPDGRALYLDRWTPTTTDTQLLKLDLGTLSVLNDANWVYHNGKRTLYSDTGIQTFSATGDVNVKPVALHSKWYNLDDVLGIVCLRTSGTQTYLPNHKPARGRNEQMFSLNVEGPNAGQPLKPLVVGRPIAETVLVFLPGQKHDATRQAATKMKCMQDPETKSYRVLLEDGTPFSINLDKSTIAWQ